jgi:transposase
MGHPPDSQHFDLTESRARCRIKAFLKGGFEGRNSKQSPGPPVKVTPAVLESLKAMLETTEQTWNAPQLQEWLKEKHDLQVHRRWLSEVLVKNGISYKRTARTLRHKHNPQQVADKEADLEALKKGQTPG